MARADPIATAAWPRGERARTGSRAIAPPALVAAILLGVFWCVEGIDLNAPQPLRVALLLAGLALLAGALAGRRVGPLAALYAIPIAWDERFTRAPLEDGSDVVRATAEALDVALAGGNPYTHHFTTTVPPGSPFVYPPGELAFYLPAHLLVGDLSRVDTVAGIAVVALVVVMGLRAGWSAVALPAMLYASWGIAGYRAIDGQNDVAASLPVVASLACLAFAGPDRAGRAALLASAAFFGWALAFKQFAVLVLPPLARHLAVAGAPWRRWTAVALGVAVAFALPFFLRDPGAFAARQLDALTFHQEVWGANLLATLAQRTDVTPLLPLFFGAELALTAAAVVFAMRARFATIGAAALGGAVIVTIPLLLARWTTQPYYVYVAAVAVAGLALLNVEAWPRYQTRTRRGDNAANVEVASPRSEEPHL